MTLDSGAPCDTGFHTLAVYSTTVGTIRFSLHGGAERTFCGAGTPTCDNVAMTIPTTPMDPLVQLLTDTAAAKTIYLDAFKFKARVATGTTNKRN